MYKLIAVSLIFLLVGSVSAQTDKNGNPIFNSVTTEETSFADFNLSSNYYTLKNNIENKNSSVFIKKNPSIDQVKDAAINLPSDFFIITKGPYMINMVMIINKPKRVFLVVEPQSGRQSEYKCKLKGDISESRAKEIIEEFDPSARIVDGYLHINQCKLKVISNTTIKAAVLNLIEKKKLANSSANDTKLLSQTEIKEIILAESKPDGRLDFFTEIKGKEYDGVQVKPGVFTTLNSIALYKWGQANFELGVNTVEDAYAIFSEFKARKIGEQEKDYIKMGFEKEWEK